MLKLQDCRRSETAATVRMHASHAIFCAKQQEESFETMVRYQCTRRHSNVWLKKIFFVRGDCYRVVQRNGCCRSTTRRWRPIYGRAGGCGPYGVSGKLCRLPLGEPCRTR